MPRYLTIGYGDEAGYNRTSPDLRATAHKQDEILKQRGAIMGIAGSPTQVRNPEARGIQTENAPYLTSPLPVAGFALIEAANLTEAIDLVSQSPCAIAHGVVEIWPLQES